MHIGTLEQAWLKTSWVVLFRIASIRQYKPLRSTFSKTESAG
jgi:hypothetical protein